VIIAFAAVCAAFSVGVSPASATFQGSVGKLLYFGSCGGGDGVCTRDLDATNPPTLVTSVTSVYGAVFGPVGGPVWSPDGTKIAYSQPISYSLTAIYVVNADGTGAHQVSQPPALCTDGTTSHYVSDNSPQWSPDGSKLAFDRSTDCSDGPSTSVFVVQKSGGSGAQVPGTQGSGGDALDAWSPAGPLLVTGWRGLVEVDPTTGAETRDLTSDTGPNGQFFPAPGTDMADYSPDGSRLVINGGYGPTFKVVDLITGATNTYPGMNARFSPDGSWVIYEVGDLTAPTLHELRLPDPSGDIAPGEPDDRSLGISVLDPYETYDVQAQQLPIIFVPGFLASTIDCQGQPVWPPTLGNLRPDLDLLDLKNDGVSNANCGTAGADGSILTKVLGVKDITATMQDYLNNLKLPAGAGGGPFPITYFGWDWRKRPQLSVNLLERAVQTALAGQLQKDEGATRVVLFGHSYGGLLIRTFLSQHRDQVARVLTEGTPYWGAPKVMFPLGFGVETPGPCMLCLDPYIDNLKMQRLAQNLAGLYELFPSQSYGSWLTVSGRPANVPLEVKSLGGNTTLYQDGQDDHEMLFDGFTRPELNDLDYRIVAGGGVPTVTAVGIQPVGLGNEADVSISLGNGDGTVPLRSAAWGGMTPPLPAHLQIICGVEHIAEPNSRTLLDAYNEWFTSGRTPRKLATSTCSDQGGLIGFDSYRGLSYGPTQAADLARPLRRARGHSASTLGMTLSAAASQGLIDLFRLNPQVLAVVNGSTPALKLTAKHLTLSYSTYSTGNQAAPRYFGPLTGTVMISPAPAGMLPVVRDNGHIVRPSKRPPVVCLVPDVKGRTLRQATRALQRAHCKLGHLTKPKRSKRGQLVVGGQAIQPFISRRTGTAVGLTMRYQRP
jgi:pimeloyl-ACP methyl ester carboxylesterase